MFNSLFNSLFGKTKDNNNCSNNKLDDLRDSNESDQIDAFEDVDGNVIAVLLDEDKDWLLVEKEIEEISTDSIEKNSSNKNLQLVPFKNIFAHLGSISENDENSLLSANLPSLYPNSMDASWILTPPECFSSVSSMQLESSPLENLLIEHPSMSVYYNFHKGPKALAGSVSDVIEDLVVVELTSNNVAEEKSQKVRISALFKEITLNCAFQESDARWHFFNK